MNTTLRNWLIGLLTSVALSLSGATVATVQTSASRIAVLEAQVNDTRQRLERIEAKLDHLLERDRRKPEEP